MKTAVSVKLDCVVPIGSGDVHADELRGSDTWYLVPLKAVSVIVPANVTAMMMTTLISSVLLHSHIIIVTY
jgi:hypothetical protein